MLRFFGLGLCLIPACIAQQSERILIPFVHSVTISVTSTAARGCDGTISSSVTQQDATDLLRGTGFQFRDNPNAKLLIDQDCETVRTSRQSSEVLIHQCLILSEAVPAESQPNSANFATSWRRCQSQQCVRPNCQQMTRAQLHGLLMQFLKSFQEYKPPSETSLLERRPQPPSAPTVVAKSEVGSQIRVASIGSDGDLVIRDVFYSLYLASCIALFVYWLARAQPR